MSDDHVFGNRWLRWVMLGLIGLTLGHLVSAELAGLLVNPGPKRHRKPQPGPGAGHPERLCPEIPLSATERALAGQLPSWPVTIGGEEQS